jgi:hypothetical protein
MWSGDEIDVQISVEKAENDRGLQKQGSEVFDMRRPSRTHLFVIQFYLLMMKCSAFVLGALATFALAQTPAPYTDVKSGITFNTLQHSSGIFFGLALPANATGSTDFIATIGGKGTGWSGVSLGGGMLNKLLIVAWPNAQAVVGSFRKTA